MSSTRHTDTADDFDSAGELYSYAIGSDGYIRPDGADARWRWTGFALTDTRARTSIAAIPDLPPDARACLLAGGRRVYMKQAGGWLFGTLPDIRHRHYGEAQKPGLVHFALNGETLLTARKSPLQTIDDIRLKIEQRQAVLPTPASFLDAAITHLLDRLEDRLDDLFEELDSIEDRVIGGRWAAERERLAPLRRHAIVVHRHLFLVSGLFRPLSTEDIAAIAPEIRSAMENSAARAGGLLHDSEQLQARALLVQEEIMARLSERTNKLLYLLSILTAVLMPTTIIAGLFGMNVPGIPFANSGFGFWEAAFLSAVGAAGVFLYVRRLGRKE